jgi:hypothetical protein
MHTEFPGCRKRGLTGGFWIINGYFETIREVKRANSKFKNNPNKTPGDLRVYVVKKSFGLR